MSTPLSTTDFEQSPENRQRFGEWVQSHAHTEEEHDEIFEDASQRFYAVTPGSLDVPATGLNVFDNRSRRQIELYGISVVGAEAIMTLLQEDGGDVSLFVNKPRQLKIGDEYLERILDRLDDLEEAGEIRPIETKSD